VATKPIKLTSDDTVGISTDEVKIPTKPVKVPIIQAMNITAEDGAIGHEVHLELCNLNPGEIGDVTEAELSTLWQYIRRVD
jgi:hypothetical protein